MADLPTGTVTFLFTDIEGSTKLLQLAGSAYVDILAAHHRIMRDAIEAGGGVEVTTEGDAFFAAFATVPGALRAVVRAQRDLAGEPWTGGHVVRVRMGLHTGEGVLSDGTYVGLDVHRAARIAAVAHGGQVLISGSTRSLAEQALPAGVSLRDLGSHRLKDIEAPERLQQLVIDGLPSTFPPVRSEAAPLTNLVPERTSFVGREREVEAIIALLGRTRLLTLTGPGGIGKTRLAAEVAAGQLERFADGVFFVDMSQVTGAGLMAPAIARALVVREQLARDPLDTVVDHLRDRQALLILDNLEQIIDPAPVVGRLLDGARRLVILATSRAPLHVAGEQEFAVPPLAHPDSAGVGDIDALGRYEAIRLFVERASAARPGFGLTAENAAAIAQLTSRLDGLPLAIELAAGRSKLMSPDSMLARLETRLSLLTGGPRDLPARQQTLRAAIEWSHELLQPAEQQLFARSVVFSGGWSLDAAEAVCGPGLPITVLDGMGSLIDQSLVRQIGGPGDDDRFAMLETIHEYAAERLGSSGERDEMRRRHAVYFLALAEGGGRPVRDSDAAPIRRLEVERDNLRAALGWAVETGEAGLGLRTATAIWTFWPGRDLDDGRAWLERLLALPGARHRDAVRARALTTLGAIEVWRNDYQRSRAALEEAAEIGRELQEPKLVAQAIMTLEPIVRAAGDFDRATALAREGLAAAVAADDRALSAEFRGRFGLIDIFRGHPDAAIEPLREAIAIQREAGATSQVALLLASLGTAERMTGDMAAATRRYREALDLSLRDGNLVIVGTIIVGFAFIASDLGRHERAARLVGAASRIRRDAGGGPLPELLRRLGDPEGKARRALGDDAAERAMAEGEAMAIEEGLSFALADGEPPLEGTDRAGTGA